MGSLDLQNWTRIGTMNLPVHGKDCPPFPAITDALRRSLEDH